jgi:phage protein D
VGSGAINFQIKIGGNPVSNGNFHSFVVERDVNQPDMCAVVLANQASYYTAKYKITDEIEIIVGSDKSIYKGEIVGIEPHFKGGGKTTVLFRGMNKLHQLIRKRKSVTFAEKKESDILKQVLADSGLDLDWKHDKADPIQYKHVYQHNQSDLEFLRTRAGRIGAHVWCVDKKVSVKYPDLQNESGIKLLLNSASKSASKGTSGDGGKTTVVGLKNFTPRMSSAPVVKKVTVKGWNPETKELITATATASGSKLGSKDASQAAGNHGGEETFTVDHPIWSKEEAQAVAEGRLIELSLGYITGEADCSGNSEFDLGQVIEVNVDDADAKDPFTGKYYVMGITHRYSSAMGSSDGFTSTLRLARDAQDE